MGFKIEKNREYYEIRHNGLLISTADTEHEAERDIEEYENQIEQYIKTGNLANQTVAILLR